MTDCPYCAKPNGLHIATTCLECNKRFFIAEKHELDTIRSRGAWLSKWHGDSWPEIRAAWRELWKKA